MKPEYLQNIAATSYLNKLVSLRDKKVQICIKWGQPTVIDD
jgi:hypothetical protein